MLGRSRRWAMAGCLVLPYLYLACGSDEAPQYSSNKDGGSGTGGSTGGVGGKAGSGGSGGMGATGGVGGGSGGTSGATGGSSGAGGSAGSVTDGGKTCTTKADCADNNPCNGEEGCTGGFCTNGTQLADGTACSTAAPDAAVSDGGLGSKCSAGSCVASCTQDKDCDDGNRCTGVESCNPTSKLCQSGSPLVCSDTSPCTDNKCDPDTGCVFPLIDADGDGHAASSLGSCGDDCNDNDKTVFKGASELCDGKDNDCNGQTDETAPTWFADCDGDGFSSLGAPSVAGCTKPATPHSSCNGKGGWTSLAPTTGQADCWDGDANAHPYTAADEVNAFKDVPILGAPTTVKRFDYNCDGTEEPRFTATGASTTGACTFITKGGSICGFLSSTGWTAGTVPPCGTSSEYTYCAVDRLGTTCSRIVQQRVQQCR